MQTRPNLENIVHATGPLLRKLGAGLWLEQVIREKAGFSSGSKYKPEGKPPVEFDLSRHMPLSIGGEEEHLLSKAEMPKHDHSNSPFVFLMQSDSNWTTRDGGDQTSNEPNLHTVGRINVEGGDKSHRIIPPYIALYYCKKD
jgi:hypothetical protein